MLQEVQRVESSLSGDTHLIEEADLNNKSHEKRVLIVSNNPLSYTENNGKTILSYFANWDAVDVMQVYFRPEMPDAVCGASANTTVGMTFFQLTDRQVLGKKSGNIFTLNVKDVQQELSAISKSHQPQSVSRLYRANIRNRAWIKLLREIPWKCYSFRKKNQQLFEAIKAFDPDLLFFCAGDALFSFDIVKDIINTIPMALVLYITDDYILPYQDTGLISSYRRSLIRKNMLEVADSADMIFTIGKKMKQTYESSYGIVSESLVNMSEDHYSVTPYPDQTSDTIWQLVYAGGLHYDRDLVLGRLIRAIESVHKRVGRTCFHLNIYSSALIDKQRIQALDSSVSTFCGHVKASKMEEVFRSSDVLVFVESGDLKAIRSTALSLSTKVPEYMSYNRAILTIGSMASYSVEYLRPYSLYAEDRADAIEAQLLQIVETPQLLQQLASQAYSQFKRDHAPEQVKQAFRNVILDVKRKRS